MSELSATNARLLSLRFKIDGVCQHFEAAWESGPPPRIEDYLAGVPGPERSVLLAELLARELAYLRRRGETPSREAYLARFPELLSVLDLLFGEAEPERDGDKATLTSPPDMPFASAASTGEKQEVPKPLQRSAPNSATVEPPMMSNDTSLPTSNEWARVPPRAHQPEDSWATAPPQPMERSPATGTAHLTAIADYEILSALGRGGMGVVYKAVHRKLKRTVALKMILDADHAGPEQVARFRLEAEAIARIKHPNIVQIFEIGEASGKPFIALEFVEGGNLHRYCGTPQPAAQAAVTVAVMARAMHAAHQVGVVHRDLKPANVLLSPKADATLPLGELSANLPLSAFEPKITDFGLAKQLDTATDLSRTGDILGTPSFMAPEQAQGRLGNIGPATDVYALAAILYDLLTGRPPFKGSTAIDTLEQVRGQEPVALSRLQPKIPRDLETICLKGLRKDPRQRYHTALEFAEDLDRFLDAQPIRARPVPAWERAWKWTRREPAKAAAIGAAILALAATTAGGIFFGLYKQQQANALTQKLERQQVKRQEVDHLRDSAEAAEAVNDLAAAARDLDKALDIVRDEPDAVSNELRSRMEAGRERVGRMIAEQEAKSHQIAELAAAKKDFADRSKRFSRRRDQVRFHAISFGKENVGADTAVVSREAPEALKALGLEISKPAAEFGAGLNRFQGTADSQQQLDQLAAECYQLLLDWSAAAGTPSPDAGEVKADPVLALGLLDAAEALATGHSLPTPQVFHLRRARLHEQLGHGSEAKADRLRAAAIPPNSTIDRFESALGQYRNSQLDQAAANCAWVLQREPGHFWAQYVAALCNLRKKEWIAAEARLNACLEKRRDEPLLLMHRALARAGAGNLALAEADFALVLQGREDPNYRAEVLTNRAYMWTELKRWPDAERDLLQAIELQPADPRRYATLAVAYQNQHKREDALKAMNEAIKRQPGNAVLYFVRAQLHLVGGQTKEARSDFEACVAREPKGSPRWADARVELARIKSKAGETAAAMDDCDAVLQSVPDFAPAHLQRAELLLRVDPLVDAGNKPDRVRRARLADAEKALDRYLKTGGKDTREVHRARGLIHTISNRHFEASEEFTRALLLKEDAETHSLRGWASLAQEAPQPALADFDAALRLEPAHIESQRGRAASLFLLGRGWEAEEAVQKALKQGLRTPELLFQVACIYGFVAGHRGAERSSLHYQERARELLAEALQLIPDKAERRAFWQNKVEKAAPLVSIRGRNGMQELARLYVR
jgi:serine/threonine protein kinase/tetratricopeptide (TPR) repeat protein